MRGLRPAPVIGGALGLWLAAAAWAAPADGIGGRNGRRGPGAQGPRGSSTFVTAVPEHAGSIVLGRPGRNSVTASLLLNSSAQTVLVWGTDAKTLSATGRAIPLGAGVPQTVVLDGLQPDTRYVYELRDAVTGARLLPAAGPGAFHTARPAGAAFAFTVTADSHLDEHTTPAVYQRTLANALADAPDFHVDLGDTSMTEKHMDRDSALKQYLAQRYYLGALAQSAPLFLVLGNHDGEYVRGRNDRSLAVWACGTRKQYFPNPEPDGFYSGNAARDPEAGLLQDYYAWEWGDALFVVLDPFWYPQNARGQRDNWTFSLGETQYQWLKRTLEGSRAKFKFVFIHHLAGGLDQNRGGAAAASFYEWGGKNPDGTDGFREYRPGWALPIHPLLVTNHVSIVFHGHDHLYAKEDLDGIVYLEVPQPGDPRGNTRSAAEYGYTSGTILGSSGHVRVKIAGGRATVDYVRNDGTAAHSFTVAGFPRTF